MVNLDKFVGKRVVITCARLSTFNKVGTLQKLEHSIAGYTHRVVDSDSTTLMYTSEQGFSKELTFKPIKKRIG
jgi:hypothetical protein